jgi:RNA polymerase sigma factor for flagellar operon FliA
MGGDDLEIRNGIVAQYQPLARCIARRALSYAQSVGARTEFDDLLSLAQEGLLRAAGSFDPARGVPFSSYARLRAMGHIKDALRDDDFLTRRERQVGERLALQSH